MKRSETVALAATLAAIGVVLRGLAIIVVPGMIELSPGIMIAPLAGVLLGWWRGAIVGMIIGLIGSAIGGGDIVLTGVVNGINAAVTALPLYLSGFGGYDPRTTTLPTKVKFLCWLSSWLSELFTLTYFVAVFGLTVGAALIVLSTDMFQVQFIWVTAALLIVSLIERRLGGRKQQPTTK